MPLVLVLVLLLVALVRVSMILFGVRKMAIHKVEMIGRCFPYQGNGQEIAWACGVWVFGGK